MKIYDFNEQDRIGKNGEEVVIEYFKTNLKKEIEVVRDLRQYQIQGIDFIVKDSGATFEVKTDTRIHDNIFIETINSVRYNTLGWINTIVADWIAFYKVNQNKIYMINTLELKKLFHLGKFGLECYAIPKHTKNKKLDYGIGTSIDLPLIIKTFGIGQLEVFDLSK